MSAFRRGHTKAAKLTATQVLEIRTRYNAGETQSALSREYKISVVQIGRIVRGESWQHQYQPVSKEEMEESAAKLFASLGRPLGEEEIVPMPPDLAEKLAADAAAKSADELGLKIKGDATEDYLAKRGSK